MLHCFSTNDQPFEQFMQTLDFNKVNSSFQELRLNLQNLGLIMRTNYDKKGKRFLSQNRWARPHLK